MLQIKNFSGTNLELEGENLACRVSLVLLIYCRRGKTKALKPLTGWGTSFLLTCGGQVLQAELFSQQTSPGEGFFPSTDGEELVPSQISTGHGVYNEN